MDNLRLILVFALVLVSLLLWQAWQEDYGPASVAATATGAQPQQLTATPVTTGSGETAVPNIQVTSGNTSQVKAEMPAAATATTSSGASISVLTDLFRLDIDTKGGTIKNMFLMAYPLTLENPDEKFQLMRDQSPGLFIAQSGLIGADKELAPTHESQYSVSSDSFEMEQGKDSLSVDLDWSHPSGVVVTKRFLFSRGSYQVQVQHMVKNGSDQPWSGREYKQLQRSPDAEGGSAFMYTYTGAAIYTPDNKYEKIAFDDMEESKLSLDVTGGWIAMLQHYFIGSWVPQPDEENHFYTEVYSGQRYAVGSYTPSVTVAKGADYTFNSSLVAGPKLQNELKEIAPGLDLTVDYGWLTILAQPIFWLLGKIHSLVGNWGWSIIFLTMLIKLAFFKLSEASYKSMANMRRMTPRMTALKERFGDDKQGLNQAMMELYKKEKINPLGGCLPILVQIPVFIALYWVLLESVELRQAPFMFWLNDLSVKDPFYVLPVIMGVSMFIQQKLNPPPPDPMQAKIMMALPFIFTVMFATFPAGLVLYWVVNNVLSIAQQWYITMQIEKAAK
ncbi:MAG: membrane protein insertase YidC [Gammaproteobacteria bacterium]|nr:membrane protein insertase YidC [Gammaproteobacteria bacterium]